LGGSPNLLYKYSAKYRKMQILTPQGAKNPLTNFDETWLG